MLKKLVLLLLISVQSYGQGRDRWVDSVFRTMDLQRKVAQLFMVPVAADGPSQDLAAGLELVRQGVGSIQIMRGTPVSHARYVNTAQQQAKIPVLTAMSAEWGPAQTLDSLQSLPKAMVSAAWDNDSLRYQWAAAIGRQLRQLGVQMNLAPHADDEIRLHDYLRYFGNDPRLVARHASTFVKGQRSAGVLSAARHLTRQTSADASDTSAVFSLQNIDTAAWTVFARLSREGVDAILTDHMHLSLLTAKGTEPASLSPIFISDVLRKQLGYKGLVMASVDAYKGKMQKYKAGAAEFLAFQTGNDILISSTLSTSIVKRVTRLIRKDKRLVAQLDQSVRRILAAKYDAGLARWTPVSVGGLRKKIEDTVDPVLREAWTEATPTLLRNREQLLPVRQLEQPVASILVGGTTRNELHHMLSKYTDVTSFAVASARDTSTVQLPSGALVILGIASFADDLERQTAGWIERLSRRYRVVLVHFGNPAKLPRYPSAQAIIAAYTDQEGVPSAAAQIIFGGLPGRGTWPLTLRGVESVATRTEAMGRFSYGSPESAGVDGPTLKKIESIMQEAITAGATPGGHILVARKGKVIYQQSHGFLTYDKQTPVSEDIIYDLASVTKVSATLQAVTWLYDKGMIDIYKKASYYLPELKGSNKEDYTLKDILTHQAGLWPFLPFWTETMEKGNYRPEFYSHEQSDTFPFPVSDQLYASAGMKDSLWHWIIDARVRDKPLRTPYDYRYSDMGFYMLMHLAEKMLQTPQEEFLLKNLYGPLGATTTGYLPLRRFPASRIAPTELDTMFRKSLLTGYVHDQGAAMHGGIAGHAGLFSTANDLAKIGQMWLQGGTYGGVRFFNKETVDLFTGKQYTNSRRGLGWDKPVAGDPAGPTSIYASGATFGHTGFTGTCIWVDPTFDLVYVFLSNRVHPDMNNNKLLNANIRPRVQDVIYQAIFNYCALHPETKYP